MRQISPNVYLAELSAGCNAGVVATSAGLVLIDSPFCPREALAWRTELSRMGDVLYIINTEPHMDHIAGNFFLPGTIVSSEQSRDALDRGGEREKTIARLLELWPDAEPLLEEFALRLPTITFDDRMSLHVGGHTLHLIGLPGHSPGNLAVHIPQENVVFAGDDIVHHHGPALYQAMPSAWMRSLQVIDDLKPGIIVPGHGSVCDTRYIPEFKDELQAIIGAVNQAIARGLTKDEAVAQVDYLSNYVQYGLQITEKKLVHQRAAVKRLYEISTGEIKEEDRI